LQFSRKDSSKSTKCNIENVIDRTLSLIKTIIHQDQIQLDQEVESQLPDIVCSEQQIQQVLMNLMTNARDSLNEKYSGFDENKRILISAKRKTVENKEMIRIMVEDHGNGIPQEIENKIFEPFYSTKGRFEGTGLGLSISYGIVKEHNANLSYETKQGEYTRFYLDLPVEKESN